MRIPKQAYTIEFKELAVKRIEYKTGWNPEAIIRTLCASPTTSKNLGSGYVLIEPNY